MWFQYCHDNCLNLPNFTAVIYDVIIEPPEFQFLLKLYSTYTGWQVTSACSEVVRYWLKHTGVPENVNIALMLTNILDFSSTVLQTIYFNFLIRFLLSSHSCNYINLSGPTLPIYNDQPSWNMKWFRWRC